MLTEFQKRKLTYFFGLLDENKNGRLQVEDFTAIVENLIINLGYPFGGKDHKFLEEKSVRFFNRFAADLSGQGAQMITLDQWVKFFDVKIISPQDDELLADYARMVLGLLFDLFDEDHDGFISIDEYADIFMVYGIDIKYSAKAFTSLDRNHDGKLSKNEVIMAIQTFLTSDDQSLDGNWIFGNWGKDGYSR